MKPLLAVAFLFFLMYILITGLALIRYLFIRYNSKVYDGDIRVKVSNKVKEYFLLKRMSFSFNNSIGLIFLDSIIIYHREDGYAIEHFLDAEMKVLDNKNSSYYYYGNHCSNFEALIDSKIKDVIKNKELVAGTYLSFRENTSIFYHSMKYAIIKIESIDNNLHIKRKDIHWKERDNFLKLIKEELICAGGIDTSDWESYFLTEIVFSGDKYDDLYHFIFNNHVLFYLYGVENLTEIAKYEVMQSGNRELLEEEKEKSKFIAETVSASSDPITIIDDLLKSKTITKEQSRILLDKIK